MDIRETNRLVIEQFRAGGAVEGMHRDRLILLTTTGARTRLPRTTPLMFHRDGDRLVVIASNVGAPEHPDWYVNLTSDPRVTVEVGDEVYQATATVLDGPERERVWSQLTGAYPFFVEHQSRTERTIPLVALQRIGADLPTAGRPGADQPARS